MAKFCKDYAFFDRTSLTSAAGTFYPVTDQIEISINPEKYLLLKVITIK